MDLRFHADELGYGPIDNRPWQGRIGSMATKYQAPQSQADRDFFTVPEAAEHMGVSRQRMHELITTYSLKTLALSSRARIIKKSELEKIPNDRPTGVHIEYR